MPLVGSIIPAALGGVEARDASTERAKERRRAVVRAGSKGREEDSAELTSAVGVEGAEGLRSAKGNEEEEAHDDRAEHGYYTPQGMTQPPAGEHPPKLDVSG
jgi:hypothetical protein